MGGRGEGTEYPTTPLGPEFREWDFVAEKARVSWLIRGRHRCTWCQPCATSRRDCSLDRWPSGGAPGSLHLAERLLWVITEATETRLRAVRPHVSGEAEVEPPGGSRPVPRFPHKQPLEGDAWSGPCCREAFLERPLQSKGTLPSFLPPPPRRPHRV